MLRRLLPVALLLACAPPTIPEGPIEAAASSLYAPHGSPGAFFNPWAPRMQPSLWSVVRWRVLTRNPYDKSRSPEVRVVANDGAYLDGIEGSASVTWVGHATFAVHDGDDVLLTDPHFGKRALIPGRARPPGIPLDSVPADAFAVISHNHYDHLDAFTVEALPETMTWYVPLGMGDWFRDRGRAQVVELDWWESAKRGRWTLTCLPSQHWSRRFGQSTNEALWCSWLVDSSDYRYYFAGDTGYFHGFKEFGRRFPDIDVAMLPIGAYEPRWFMRYQHMNPAESYRAFAELGARFMLPMHWGTFDLTDEPIDLAPRVLDEVVHESGGDPERVRTLAVGERWKIPERMATVAAMATTAEMTTTTEMGQMAQMGQMDGGSSGGSERERILGPFLDRFWQLPMAPQGEAPAGFSDADRNLDPAVCGACHPMQHAQWRTSLHAGAFSPGFAGQLVEGSLAAPAEVRSCQSCHAPLAEQQPFDASLGANGGFDSKLRAQGIVCAACHVRAHRRYGPPRRSDAGPRPEVVPHDGFEVREEFRESRFCAPCHQFFDDSGVAGKPIENTFAEWKGSPHAAEGRTCQSCHMPDRSHLWRGIHDPEMVRSAVDVELVPIDLTGPALEAALVLRSRDVGHAFPTYVTPRVFLSLWQTDEAGKELEGSRREATIGREINFSTRPWSERFDTRVAPGESVKLEYGLERRPEAVALEGRVVVDPDFHYRGVFAGLKGTLRTPAARAQMEEAHRRASESRYVLAEVRQALEN